MYCCFKLIGILKESGRKEGEAGTKGTNERGGRRV
jgi:hypothetical protein